MKFILFDDKILNISAIQAVSKIDKDGVYTICCFFDAENGIYESYTMPSDRDNRFKDLCTIFANLTHS